METTDYFIGRFTSARQEYTEAGSDQWCHCSCAFTCTATGYCWYSNTPANTNFDRLVVIASSGPGIYPPQSCYSFCFRYAIQMFVYGNTWVWTGSTPVLLDLATASSAMLSLLAVCLCISCMIWVLSFLFEKRVAKQTKAFIILSLQNVQRSGLDGQLTSVSAVAPWHGPLSPAHSVPCSTWQQWYMAPDSRPSNNGLHPPFFPWGAGSPPTQLATPLDSASCAPSQGSGQDDHYSSRFEGILEDEADLNTNPFEGIPALKGFHLSGARVALSRWRSYRELPPQALELWFHAPGFQIKDGWRSVKASKITASYTGYDGAASFKAQSRHTVFPLEDGAVRHDGWLAQQQTRLGAVAHAMCLALTKVNEAADQLSEWQGRPTLTDPTDPSETGSPIFDLLNKKVATPLGHALRVLAAECSMLCKDRRQFCLSTMLEGQGWAAMDRTPASSTDLFGGDVEELIQCINRHHESKSAFKTSFRKRPSQYGQHYQAPVNKHPHMAEAGF